MSTREIVTLQVGHYSNFIGSHWWNLQESSFVYDPQALLESPKEVNHDILYREGKNLKGEVTYTPRLVAFDLSHSLGSMKKEGILYDVSTEDDIKWTGDVTLHEAQSGKRNKYLEDLDQKDRQDDDETIQSKNIETDMSSEITDENERSSSSTENPKVFGKTLYHLDDEVTVWSDYLRACLHPRSLYILEEHQHNNPEEPFNVFGLGQQAVGSRENFDKIEDKIRYFAEECDHLQGFNLLFDNHSAFGGVATTISTYLEDEFYNKANLCFPVTPACPPDETAKERSSRILNSALSLYYIGNSSSLYVPLSLASELWKSVRPPIAMPYLDYKASLDYHTSAILAAALDTATLPFRKEMDAMRMYDITSAFNSYGRKVCALNGSLPFPVHIGKSFSQSLIQLGDGDPWLSLTPHVKCTHSPIFQSCVVRGMPKLHEKRIGETHHIHHSLAACTSLDDVLKLYLAETYPQSVNATCVMNNRLKLDASYPHIFKPNVNHEGFLTDTKRSPNCGVESVPLMTSLQSTTDVFPYIDTLEGCVSRFNLSKHQHFIEAGLDVDEFSEVLQGLKDLAQNYKDTS